MLPLDGAAATAKLKRELLRDFDQLEFLFRESSLHNLGFKRPIPGVA